MDMAILVAEYIIAQCIKIDMPISNICLQKLLYIAQAEYRRTTGQRLFQENFVAYSFGPGLKSVYNAYCIYGASAIYPTEKADPAPEIKRILDRVVCRCRPMGTCILNCLIQKEAASMEEYYTI